jgi:deoxyhypusine monooxygenase
MRHEFAYVLGQLRNPKACDNLEFTLADATEDTMVRHECAEALGNIGEDRSTEVLRAGSEDAAPEVSETCAIALSHLAWKKGGSVGEEPTACVCQASPYSSVDPAPPHPTHLQLSTAELSARLLDESQPLFERYRCMFSLRNRGGKEAVLALCATLTQDKSSSLLRHEIAYVLGQVAHDASLEALAESAQRQNEHRMVRHEACESIGAIEGRWAESEKLLQGFLNDKDEVVRQSCLVALDAADYWGLVKSNDDEEEHAEPPTTFVAQKNA